MYHGRLGPQAFSSSHNEHSSINVRQRSRSQFELCYLPSSSFKPFCIHIHIHHANSNINNILPRLGQDQAETWHPGSWYDSPIPTSCSFLEESFSNNSVAMLCLWKTSANSFVQFMVESVARPCRLRVRMGRRAKETRVCSNT